MTSETSDITGTGVTLGCLPIMIAGVVCWVLIVWGLVWVIEAVAQ